MYRIAIIGLLAVVSCAGGVGVPLPGGPTVTHKPRHDGSAFAGFDKRDFPGSRDMQVWFASSPYEWVGYYLPSPCFSGTAWTGNRQELVSQGWGLAVLYVGLQAPRPAAVSADTSRAGIAAPTRCSQNALSAEQGKLDADDAVNVASADGFAEQTTIFLDVERADPYPAELDAYVRSWATQVLARKFTPGIYGHRLNAAALYASAKAVYTAAGDARQPPFWVSSSQGFDFGKMPGDSGFPFATIWQNPSDASETYGGVTFRIDGNVSSRKNPSG